MRSQQCETAGLTGDDLSVLGMRHYVAPTPHDVLASSETPTDWNRTLDNATGQGNFTSFQA